MPTLCNIFNISSAAPLETPLNNTQISFNVGGNILSQCTKQLFFVLAQRKSRDASVKFAFIQIAFILRTIYGLFQAQNHIAGQIKNHVCFHLKAKWFQKLLSKSIVYLKVAKYTAGVYLFSVRERCCVMTAASDKGRLSKYP